MAPLLHGVGGERLWTAHASAELTASHTVGAASEFGRHSGEQRHPQANLAARRLHGRRELCAWKGLNVSASSNWR